MYEFTIEYYYQYYHTGNLDKSVTRTAVVYADTRNEAIQKLKIVDDDCACLKNIFFREMKEVEE